MTLTRRAALGAATLLAAPAVQAQPLEPIRIGVLTDLGGPYRDVTGPTSVACAKLAVDEFTAANPGIPVELLSADHQNRPDTGLSIVREWFDRRGVDAIGDIGNSAIALGLGGLLGEKDKVQLNASAGTSEITGRSCNANTVHWTYDTWACSHTVAEALTKAGGDTWYFITADYAFGRAIQNDTTSFVTANGGRLLGASAYPFPGTTDFSAFLLQAQASRAKVLGLAMAGDDLNNCVKQAQEFGLVRQGVKLAAIIGSITSVVSEGLRTMQGLNICEGFYWDLNDRTRAFRARMAPRLPATVVPNGVHAGNYSSVTHYLKAVKALGHAAAKASGRAVIAQMKRMPTDDDAFGAGTIRVDGRKIHPMHLFEVKKPEESRGFGDVYKLVGTTPAEQAFRPLADGGCALVR
jgi:branched-chain amino acid transport system substrate-binding protein